MKPEDIPQDVWDTAVTLVAQSRPDESWTAIVARAFIAERERCAAIAEEHERARWGWLDMDPTVALRKTALSIATAIRTGGKP